MSSQDDPTSDYISIKEEAQKLYPGNSSEQLFHICKSGSLDNFLSFIKEEHCGNIGKAIKGALLSGNPIPILSHIKDVLKYEGSAFLYIGNITLLERFHPEAKIYIDTNKNVCEYLMVYKDRARIYPDNPTINHFDYEEIIYASGSPKAAATIRFHCRPLSIGIGGIPLLVMKMITSNIDQLRRGLIVGGNFNLLKHLDMTITREDVISIQSFCTQDILNQLGDLYDPSIDIFSEQCTLKTDKYTRVHDAVRMNRCDVLQRLSDKEWKFKVNHTNVHDMEMAQLIMQHLEWTDPIDMLFIVCEYGDVKVLAEMFNENKDQWYELVELAFECGRGDVLMYLKSIGHRVDYWDSSDPLLKEILEKEITVPDGN